MPDINSSFVMTWIVIVAGLIIPVIIYALLMSVGQALLWIYRGESSGSDNAD